MKRKNLETTMCGIQDLIKTINELKNHHNDKETQIEVLETNMMKDCYFVTIWWVR